MADDQRNDELRLRLEEAMGLHGWSQTDVTTKTGITQPTISRFLRGGGLTDSNLKKVRDLIEGEGEAAVPSSQEMRQAIRLYRYIRRISEEGTTFVLREPDGNERALLILW